MAFKISANWKETLKGVCPCFTNFPTVPSNCSMDGRCPCNSLRVCLSMQLPMRPHKIDLMVAFLRTGAFVRKQLHEAFLFFYKLEPQTVDRDIRHAKDRLKTTEEVVRRGDTGSLSVSKRIKS